MNASKIMIGSAQFGLDYGLANGYQKVPQSQVAKILDYASQQKITMIDTASAYGESETVLGALSDNRFRFVTKLAPYQGQADIAHYVSSQIHSSLAALNISHCEGVLMHHADDLLSPHGESIYQQLMQLKQAGLVKKVGVSVYSPELLLRLLHHYQFDIVQCPINLFDQRFLAPEVVQALQSQQCEIHARSLFLQGILLMPIAEIPDYFMPIKHKLQALDALCQENGISRRQAIMQFLTSLKAIDYFIMGVNTVTQLEELVRDCSSEARQTLIVAEDYVCDDLSLINPSLWCLNNEKA